MDSIAKQTATGIMYDDEVKSSPANTLPSNIWAEFGVFGEQPFESPSGDDESNDTGDDGLSTAADEAPEDDHDHLPAAAQAEQKKIVYTEAMINALMALPATTGDDTERCANLIETLLATATTDDDNETSSDCSELIDDDPFSIAVADNNSADSSQQGSCSGSTQQDSAAITVTSADFINTGDYGMQPRDVLEDMGFISKGDTMTDAELLAALDFDDGYSFAEFGLATLPDLPAPVGPWSSDDFMMSTESSPFMNQIDGGLTPPKKTTKNQGEESFNASATTQATKPRGRKTQVKAGNCSSSEQVSESRGSKSQADTFANGFANGSSPTQVLHDPQYPSPPLFNNGQSYHASTPDQQGQTDGPSNSFEVAQPRTPPQIIQTDTPTLQSPFDPALFRSGASVAPRPYTSPYNSPHAGHSGGNTPTRIYNHPPPLQSNGGHRARASSYNQYGGVQGYNSSPLNPNTSNFEVQSFSSSFQHQNTSNEEMYGYNSSFQSPNTMNSEAHGCNSSFQNPNIANGRGSNSPEEFNTYNGLLPSRDIAVLQADTARRRRIASGTAQRGDEDATMFLQQQQGQQQVPRRISFDRNPAHHLQNQAIIEELGMSKDSPQGKAMLNTVERWSAESIYMDPEKLKSSKKAMQVMNNSPAHLQSRRDVEYYKSLVLNGRRDEAQHFLEQMVLQLKGPRAMEVYMEWVKMGEEARNRLGKRYLKPTDAIVHSGPPCPVHPEDKSEAAEAARQQWFADYKENYAMIDSQIHLMREASLAYQQAVTFNASGPYRELVSAPLIPEHLRGDLGSGKRKASPDSVTSSPKKRAYKKRGSVTNSPVLNPGLEGAVRELTSVVATLKAEVMIIKGEIALLKAMN